MGAAALAECLTGLGLREALINTGGGGLNESCGADYVQKERRPPQGFAAVPAGARCGTQASGLGLKRMCF